MTAMDNYTGNLRAMSRHKLFKTSSAVWPWRSRHMNSSKYEDSIWRWQPLMRLIFVFTITFHVLGVNPCGWIDKFNRMIDRLVLGLYTVISCPLITPHSCPRTNMLLDYWEEGSTRNYCHDTKCWSEAGVDHSEHPDVTSWWASPVVLNDAIIFLWIISVYLGPSAYV